MSTGYPATSAQPARHRDLWGRTLLSLWLGFMVATVGPLIWPAVAQPAGPLVCRGSGARVIDSGVTYANEHVSSWGLFCTTSEGPVRVSNAKTTAVLTAEYAIVLFLLLLVVSPRRTKTKP